MALITCPECGKEISDKAEACPYCGKPMKNDEQSQDKALRKDSSSPKSYLKWSFMLWPLYLVEIIVFLMVQIEFDIGELGQTVVMGIIAAINISLAALLIYGIIKNNFIKSVKSRTSIASIIALTLCALFIVMSGKIMINAVADTVSDNSSQRPAPQVELTEDEEKALTACNDLKSRLKNPSSLQLNQIIVTEDTVVEHAYYVFIDYSAQNGLGGTTRGLVVYKNGTYYTNDGDESGRFALAKDTLNFCHAMGCPYVDVDVKTISDNLS